VGSGWTDDGSLYSFVVISAILSAAKVKESYGQFQTNMQMKGVPGLNLTSNDVEKLLNQLRIDRAGGF
jgi:hypothetical protein